MFLHFELPKADQRSLLCASIIVQALNAVFCTGLRDGLPEWSRTHPFDCLHALVHHLTKLLSPTGEDNTTASDEDKRDDFVPSNNIDTSSWSTRTGESRQTRYRDESVLTLPLIKLSLHTLSATAITGFLYVMTRSGFRWIKIFSILYQLHWFSSKVLPQPPVLSNPERERRCRLAMLVGLSLTLHSLTWYIYSSRLNGIPDGDYWWYFCLHQTVAIVIAAAIARIPRTEPNGAVEAFCYAVHLNAFVLALISTFYSTRLQDRNPDDFVVNPDGLVDWGEVYFYECSTWAFVVAKNCAGDRVRWPGGVLASLLLLGMLAQVNGKGFRF